MTHHLLLTLARTIRFLRRWAMRLSIIIFLIVMNVATVVSDTVYDILNHAVWSAASMVSGQLGERRPKTRAELAVDLERSRGEAGAARSEAETAKKETTKVRAELDETRARNRALSADLETKNRRIAQMAGDIDSSKRTRQQAIETTATLRKRLVRGIQRDASSDALEAVPFIGTAVVLGAIAYEVNDACMQLRELEALDSALRGNETEPVSEAICLKSFDEIVSALTGKDRGYAKCVSDRVATGDLDPPSCAGYPMALPKVEASVVRSSEGPVAPTVE